MGFNLDFFENPSDLLTLQHGQLFWATGQALFTSVAVIILITYLWRNSLTGTVILFFNDYIGKFLLCMFILQFYYNVPSWLGISMSLHQLLPTAANYYAGIIEQKRLDTLASYTGAVLYQVGRQVTIRDIAMMPTAWLVQLLTIIYQAAITLAIGVTYIMIGLLNLIGPLFVWCIMVPKWSHFFWNWLQAYVEFCLYRVVAAGLVFIATDAFISYAQQVINGDYNLTKFFVGLGALITLVVGEVIAILRIGTVVSNISKGSSSAGAGVLATVASARRGFIK